MHQVAKNWSFSISPSNEYSRLISRIDWFDLLLVLETLQSLLQHHNSKASILQRSAFFIGSDPLTILFQTLVPPQKPFAVSGRKYKDLFKS